MTTLEQARALRQRGLSVFRIPLGSKVPDQPWKAWQARLATDEDIVAMFGDAPANIGIVTGTVSNIVVVDADTEAAVRYAVRRLPYTPWQTRTSRGVHFFFAHPGVLVPNRGTDLRTVDGLLPVHIRGDGGYVLAPGSVHPDGPIYREVGRWHWPFATLPRFWPGWLRPLDKSRPYPTAPPSREFGVLERARRYLAAIPVPHIGHGSDTATLSAACRLVRGFALTASEAEDLLWEWCGNRPGWTRAWVADKVANAERYGTEAMGGLR